MERERAVLLEKY
jgi:chromosome segregation ATPase